MRLELKTKMLADLDRVIEARKNIRQPNPQVFVTLQDTSKVISLALSAIERNTGENSAYTRQAREFSRQHNQNHLSNDFSEKTRVLNLMMGVIDSLREDIAADAIEDIEELIHGELFGDFLEMASHLLDEGYKDAAAVIAGSSLEAHLRQLCIKNGIDVTRLASDGSTPAKRAEQLNTDLASASVYSKADQKSVTAWLDLRNKAAHGHYSEYVREQIGLLISGIQDFIRRNSA